MRMSSPTYDDQVESLSQDHISAFDALLSQHTFHENRTQSLGNTDTLHTESNDMHRASSDDEGDPFASKVGESSKGNPPHNVPAGPSFMKASSLSQVQAPAWNDADDQGDSANPSDVDYSSWFQSSVPTTLVGFKTAATALQSSSKVSATSVEPRPSEGLLVPSTSAFLKAKAKIKLWNDEDESATSASQQHDIRESTPPSRAMSPPRPTFTPASKVFSTPVPEAPVPAARGRAVPPQFLVGKQPKPFKSPLVTNSPLRQSTINNIGSPLRPTEQPLVPPSPMVSQQPLGFTPARSNTRPRFVTPFKNGIAPGACNLSVLKTPTPFRYNIVNPVYPPSTVHEKHEDKPTTKVSHSSSWSDLRH